MDASFLIEWILYQKQSLCFRYPNYYIIKKMLPKGKMMRQKEEMDASTCGLLSGLRGSVCFSCGQKGYH